MGKGVGVPEKDNYYTVGPWLDFDPNKERHTGEHAADANVLLKDPNNSGLGGSAAISASVLVRINFC